MKLYCITESYFDRRVTVAFFEKKENAEALLAAHNDGFLRMEVVETNDIAAPFYKAGKVMWVVKLSLHNEWTASYDRSFSCVEGYSETDNTYKVFAHSKQDAIRIVRERSKLT